MVKVLFGMIVKERRRVTTLARTASKLDEKAHNLDHERGAIEVALRTQLTEHKHARSTMANEQQELILSLMSLVKEGSSENNTSADFSGQPSTDLVVMFAQKRIQALEDEVQALLDECNSFQNTHEQINELKALLEVERNESEALRNELAHVRDILRQVRDTVPPSLSDSHTKSTSRSSSPLLGLAVLPSSKSFILKDSSTKTDVHNLIQKTLNRPLSAATRSSLYFSDTEEDYETNEDIPDWVDDIMADLQVIADGGVPDSLRSCSPAENVFARLTDPHNFTGTQKHKTERPSTADMSSDDNQKDISVATTSIVSLNPQFSVSDQDNDLLEISGEVKSVSRQSKGAPSFPPKPKRSVYQRLLSPSSFTGTQKHAIFEENQESVRIQGQSLTLENELVAEITPPAVAFENSSTEVILQAQKPFAPIFDKKEDYPISSKLQQPKSGKNSTYMQQDVFERLQHTVTAAYAKKKDISPPDE